MLMFNANDGGYHNFQEEDVDAARKAGWVDGEPIRKAAIAAKTKPATIEPQVVAKRSPGRPRMTTDFNYPQT